MSTTIEDQKKFMRRAIELAQFGMRNNHGGPFGAVIVKDNIIIGEGFNSVTSTNDPTAHAEVVAIRNACQTLGHFQLDDCTIYTTCEPCPMCLGAIYWARPKAIIYACTKEDAANFDFDDQHIYQEINTPVAQRTLPTHTLIRQEALRVFEEWKIKADKTAY